MHHWSRRLLNSSDFAIWSGWVIRWWNLINLVCELSCFSLKNRQNQMTRRRRQYGNNFGFFLLRKIHGKYLVLEKETGKTLGVRSNFWVKMAIVGCSRQFFIFFTQNRFFLAQNILTYPLWLENQVIQSNKVDDCITASNTKKRLFRYSMNRLFLYPNNQLFRLLWVDFCVMQIVLFCIIHGQKSLQLNLNHFILSLILLIGSVASFLYLFENLDWVL